jgi:hypothetical protein
VEQQQPEPDDLCYKLSMTDYITYVSVDEAYNIEKQLQANATILMFYDVNRSRTVLPVKDFNGMWETSPEIRDRCNEWNEAITEEEKQRTNKWKD